MRRERSSILRACVRDNSPYLALGRQGFGGQPVKALEESNAGANKTKGVMEH